MKGIIDKLGGRKFVSWVVSAVGLVVAGATGTTIPPEILDTLTTIFGIFVGGNALEHGAQAIGTTLEERRSRLHLAAAAAKEDVAGGEVKDD